MSQGTGGWVLDVECVACGAQDAFRAVLLTLAADAARRAGWDLPSDLSSLGRRAGDRGETCPKCTDTLRG